jgi:tRNA modification GTPase
MITPVNDTIVAIATPPGYGGVGILRISGPLAPTILKKITGKMPQARYAEYLSFKDSNHQVIDMGIVLYFPAPNSFTGEDVVEFQGHGGPVVLECLMKQIIAYGARIAEAGEFSKRAYLNNKIDLAQAEAISDLISSASEQAARSAIKSLQGVFSDEIHRLVDNTLHLRMYVEAAIDFPEEEIDFLQDGIVLSKLNHIETHLNRLLAQTKQGALLREGVDVVIAGKPNAGKSSLLNILSGKDSAIVTDIAGTTRDIVKEYIAIDGVPMHIYDTAGLRESDDVVEAEGIKRAKKQIEIADLVLFVFDATEIHTRNISEILAYYQQTYLQKNQHLILLANKIDKTLENPVLIKENNVALILLSAKSQAGISLLKKQILETIGVIPEMSGGFIARRRHLQALETAKALLDAAISQFMKIGAGELLAEDLRQVQNILGEITGVVSSDDLLGMIFSSFCIGK